MLKRSRGSRKVRVSLKWCESQRSVRALFFNGGDCFTAGFHLVLVVRHFLNI